MPELKLKFHKSFDGYLGQINIPESVIDYSQTQGGQVSQPETVIILDRSGSMGQNVARLINIIIPSVLRDLGYKADKRNTQGKVIEKGDQITLITFDSSADLYRLTLNEMESANMCARGCTYFKPALQILERTQFKSDKVRILTISDGDMHDLLVATEYASSIVEKIKKGRHINSQAIRYFTSSYGQPDTRGLTSVLQFNNVEQNRLLDINASTDFEVTTKQIVELFQSDGLTHNITMETNDNLISSDPWKPAKKQLSLRTGLNTIWFRDMPERINVVGINATIIPEVSEETTPLALTQAIEDRFNHYQDHMRILKVLGTSDAQTEINQIMAYFEQFQNFLNTLDMTTTGTFSPKLAFRFQSMKRNIEQRKKSLYARLQQIANDDRVAELNSAQQASYLRGVELSRNAKGLARRALKTGFDLTDVVHQEVRQLHQHFSEIKDIDDTNHNTSFYSCETTFEGIKTLCQLVDEGLLEETTPADVIQLTNFVGIACYSPVGDYPDAMTYRVHDMYEGSYISVSDITVFQTVSSGEPMRPPGRPDKEINNCIPVFDDVKIHRFLRKYAPTLLNLVAGVGMRRVLAEVPSTHMYTVCAGLWHSIDKLSTNRSEVLIESVKQLADQYLVDAGKYFDHNKQYLDRPPAGGKSYFINNNGLTNMLALLGQMYQKHDVKFMPDILRAIYSYESYQTIKKILNKEEDKGQYVQDTLQQMLGLDYETYGVKVGDPFTETPKPEHNLSYRLNPALLSSLTNSFRWFNNMYLIPSVLEAVQHEDYLTRIKAIPTDDAFKLAQFGVSEYDWDQFVFYNAVEALLFNSKQSRCDDEKTCMRIPDVGKQNLAEKMVASYIRDFYQKTYNANLRSKKGKEYETALNQMRQVLLEGDIDMFEHTMKSGYDYRGQFVQLVNTGSQGFIELQEALLNVDLVIPDRFKKLWILIMGSNHHKEVIWNGGNALRVSLIPFQKVFEHFHKEELWGHLYKRYIENIKHVYRDSDMPNRHSHCNSKPSYWALGYKTIEDMMSKVSAEEMEEYRKIHNDCCGFAQLSLYQRKKAARNERSETGEAYSYY